MLNLGIFFPCSPPPLLSIFNPTIFNESKKNIFTVLVECGVLIIRPHPLFHCEIAVRITCQNNKREYPFRPPVGNPCFLYWGLIMTHIFVIIDIVSVKEVILKGIMLLERLIITLPNVLILPCPGWIFLYWRNQKSTIGRHDHHDVVHLLQAENIIGYVIHGAVKCVDASNILDDYVVTHHVSGNIFWPVGNLFYNIRGKHNNIN